MKFPDMDQKSLIASRASGNESWGSGRNPSDSPRISRWLSPQIGRCRIKVDVLRSWSPPRGSDSSICDWKNKFSFFLEKYQLFRIESFWVDFRCVHRLQLLKVCNQYVTLPNFSRAQYVSEKQSRQDFLSKLMDSWLVLRSYRVILNQWTKWISRSFKWLPKNVFHRASSHQITDLWMFRRLV